MFEAIPHPALVPFDGSFDLEAASARLEEPLSKKKAKKELAKRVEALSSLQEALYAQDKFSLLLVFQAMDAAGKDGTIRAVMSGINPAGCQVRSFKQPSAEEIDHDFLWRCVKNLPERGRIGIFNRSYYEEVLVVRVHPEYLDGQRIPDLPDLDQVWEERLESIADLEKHLARNGTIVLKFWLNVSRDEQKKRFIDRIDEPEKNWKFSSGDIKERGHWPKYMEAYEAALRHTSKSHAPWYAIPADDKPNMRLMVADIIVRTLRSLELAYPELDPTEKAKLGEYREQLVAEDGA